MSRDAVKFGRMSKKQREKVEDEVRYYQREKLVRPQGTPSSVGLSLAPGSIASTPGGPGGLHSSGSHTTSDPSPDSSVYDTQSQQPSSSQPLPYVYSSNSFAGGGGDGGGIGPPDTPYDTASYAYTPTAIVAYDIRNTSDFVDSTTFDPTHQHQPHSTSTTNVTHLPQQQLQTQRHMASAIFLPNELDKEKRDREVHDFVVGHTVNAHNATLLLSRDKIAELMSRSSQQADDHLEYIRRLVCIE